MIIGIDGNEANQKIRVGSGVYSFELLMQFEKSSQPKADQPRAENFKFQIYLKDKPLGDLPKESAKWKYIIVGPKKLWTQVGLPLYLWKKKILGQAPDIFLSLSHYSPRFCPVPSVVTIFDLSFLKFPEMFLLKDLFKLKNWTSYSVKQAKIIITISESSKNDIMKYYTINEERIKVVYPSYDRSRFNPNIMRDRKRIDEVKNKYKIKDEYIIFVGTIQPRKNLIRLLEALKILKRKYRQARDLKLVVAGMMKEGRGGWMQKEILNKIRNPKSEIRNEVVMTGYVDDIDIPYLIAGAKIFVLPSLYEGFGIPIIEAMASGCPVVTSNISSLPEIAGNAAIYADPYDIDSISKGIYQACYNQNIRKDLIEKGLQQIEKYSWEKSAKKIFDILKSLNN